MRKWKVQTSCPTNHICDWSYWKTGRPNEWGGMSTQVKLLITSTGFSWWPAKCQVEQTTRRLHSPAASNLCRWMWVLTLLDGPTGRPTDSPSPSAALWRPAWPPPSCSTCRFSSGALDAPLSGAPRWGRKEGNKMEPDHVEVDAWTHNDSIHACWAEMLWTFSR